MLINIFKIPKALLFKDSSLYFKEFSYEEISKILEIPLGTVKAQLHRSREQLFTIMSGSRDAF